MLPEDNSLASTGFGCSSGLIEAESKNPKREMQTDPVP
jgi:hypothetical protein